MKNIMFAFLGLAATGFVLTTSSCADPCKDVTCANGTCEDVDGDGVCNCDAGYEGTLCDTEERVKLIGTYTGADDCSLSNQSGTYTTTITAASADISGIIVAGLWENGFLNVVTATVDGSTITIANQDPDSDGFQIEGTGTYSDGVISWDYDVINTNADPNTTDACTMSATKQ